MKTYEAVKHMMSIMNQMAIILFGFFTGTRLISLHLNGRTSFHFPG